MERILDFLRRLDADNDRQWFDEHRSEWSEIKRRIGLLTGQLIDAISAFDPSVAGLRVPDCTYRIARDTRFSPDKTPYKNYVGIFIAPHGKQAGYAGYYLHIAPAGDRIIGGHALVAGLYCPEKEVLRSVRDELFDNGAEVVRAIRAARGFKLGRERALKRTPAGFPPASEFDDLLRLKDFCLERPVDEEFLLGDRLVERTAEAFRSTRTFVGLLNKAVQYAYEEMM